MATSLPYVPSYKNLPVLFDKIKSAKVPDKFNREFLGTTIGLKGSNDRAYIPLLRTLGFIDQSGTPTPQYRLLKSDESARTAIAQGVRTAYSALFDADQAANALPADKLRGIVAQVAGTDSDMTGRIAGTFSALVRLGDFTASAPAQAEPQEDGETDSSKIELHADNAGRHKGLRPEFHYNIQVHLPANGTEDVYLNIFSALRKVFQ